MRSIGRRTSIVPECRNWSMSRRNWNRLQNILHSHKVAVRNMAWHYRATAGACLEKGETKMGTNHDRQVRKEIARNQNQISGEIRDEFGMVESATIGNSLREIETWYREHGVNIKLAAVRPDGHFTFQRPKGT